MSNEINSDNFLESCFDLETPNVETIEKINNHIPVAFQIRKIGTGVIQRGGFEIIDTFLTKNFGNDADTTQRKIQDKAWMLKCINKGYTLVVVKMYADKLHIEPQECWNSNAA